MEFTVNEDKKHKIENTKLPFMVQHRHTSSIFLVYTKKWGKEYGSICVKACNVYKETVGEFYTGEYTDCSFYSLFKGKVTLTN